MSVHPSEDSVVGVLKRQVYIMEYLRIALHNIEELVRNLVGVAVEHPYPLYAVNPAELAQKLGEPETAVFIKTVGGRILSNQDYLFDARRGELLRLFDNGLKINAPVIAPDIGDGAVGASV